MPAIEVKKDDKTVAAAPDKKAIKAIDPILDSYNKEGLFGVGPGIVKEPANAHEAVALAIVNRALGKDNAERIALNIRRFTRAQIKEIVDFVEVMLTTRKLRDEDEYLSYKAVIEAIEKRLFFGREAKRMRKLLDERAEDVYVTSESETLKKEKMKIVLANAARKLQRGTSNYPETNHEKTCVEGLKSLQELTALVCKCVTLRQLRDDEMFNRHVTFVGRSSPEHARQIIELVNE